MRKNKSLLSVGDKAIFDALNQHGVTKDALRRFFLTRGIIYSAKTSRKDLAMYFSRLVHGYSDYEQLIELLQPLSRKERLASKFINGIFDDDDYESAAVSLKEKIEEGGDSAEVSFLKNGNIVIDVSYRVDNFNKSELRQTTTKKASLIIEKNQSGSTFRYQANQLVTGFSDDFIGFLEDSSKKSVDVSEISLFHISCPKVRTRFFTDLIEGLENCCFYDVTDVYVYKPKNDLDLLNDDGSPGDDVSTGIHISKASLRGEGVLSSSEFRTLLDRGFYISKIVWQSEDLPAGISDVYEFEAQFSEPDTCSVFTYLARGFYKRAGDGGISSSSRGAFTDAEERRFSQSIEFAAWRVIKALDND